jgi:GH24 family phage-related lysozyme (muramidase)
MQIGTDGLKLIQSAENFSATPYLDTAHIWTIADGHALTTPTGQVIDADVFGSARAKQLAAESMQRLCGGQTCTRAQADSILTSDLTRFVAAVNSVCDANTYQCEFDAMVSMAYNVGVSAFTSSAVARLNKAGVRKVGTVSMSGLAAQAKAKADPTSIQIAFARWSNSNGAFTLGLFRRRLAEIMVFGGMDAATALKTAWSFNG